MVNELKAITAVAVVIEGTSTNGVQSTFKFQVNPQTQDREQLERASMALPTLLDLIGVKMAAAADAPKADDLDSLDAVPTTKGKGKASRSAVRDDEDR